MKTILRMVRSPRAYPWALVFEASALPFIVKAGFLLRDVAGTQRLLRWWIARFPLTATEAPERIIRQVLGIQKALMRRTAIGGTCLTRSLVLWTLLQRRGVNSAIRIGVRKREQEIEAHAWIEWNGKALNETASNVATYTVHPEPFVFDQWRQLQGRNKKAPGG